MEVNLNQNYFPFLVGFSLSMTSFCGSVLTYKLEKKIIHGILLMSVSCQSVPLLPSASNQMCCLIFEIYCTCFFPQDAVEIFEISHGQMTF